MKIHRFYVGDKKILLRQDFWIHDPSLIKQWSKVLRFRPLQQVVLFDDQDDRLYQIVVINTEEAHVKQITELQKTLPNKEVYLAWAILKKDKNDWVIQKSTELGVSHFIPIIADRCDRVDLSAAKKERLETIAREASEQCGRGDIPKIREVLRLSTLTDEFVGKAKIIVCEQFDNHVEKDIDDDRPTVIIIGPEGGWSDAEKQLFLDKNIEHLSLSKFTLRAETACIVAAAKLLQ